MDDDEVPDASMTSAGRDGLVEETDWTGGRDCGMFDRDAARNIKMKQFGVQVRPVSEFISCGLPTKGAIVR